MNKRNTAKLFKDFPEMFRNRGNLKASLMGFGFECDNGWFDIIYQLCKDIQKEVASQKLEDFYVLQVKEKFAELRFYISSGDDTTHNLIGEAERKSRKTCEICGKPGQTSLIGGYWYKTLCEKHRKTKKAVIIKDSSEED